MLEDFTVSTFDVGDTLTLDLGEGRRLDLTLVKASARDRRLPWAKRDQFVLVFKGPAEPRLPQGMYKMRNARVGDFEMALAPVLPLSDDPESAFYQAIFC